MSASPKNLTPMETEDGWGSKKLHFGLISVAMIFSGWMLITRFPALASNFTTMVGGLTGIYALFAGANVGQKFIVGNHLVKMRSAISEYEEDVEAEAEEEEE